MPNNLLIIDVQLNRQYTEYNTYITFIFKFTSCNNNGYLVCGRLNATKRKNLFFIFALEFHINEHRMSSKLLECSQVFLHCIFHNKFSTQRNRRRKCIKKMLLVTEYSQILWFVAFNCSLYLYCYRFFAHFIMHAFEYVYYVLFSPLDFTCLSFIIAISVLHTNLFIYFKCRITSAGCNKTLKIDYCENCRELVGFILSRMQTKYSFRLLLYSDVLQYMTAK